MATVYLARAKKRPEKLLVLKLLRAELAENPEFLAMFLEEARLAGKLQHPNIVETYEVGQDAGTYYIAMEYLEGLSLQAVLTKFGWKGEFTFPLQVFVLVKALMALEHAYTHRDDDGTPLKIVHRDVSPPNIIITFDGQVKLVDFGIAKAANSHVETRTGLIKGKLTYMAPEQAQSGDVDSRTDIYSVGVMLWQAASGRRRWKGIENTDVLRRLHAGDIEESPNAAKNSLPRSVDDIVLKAIAADPERRYRSASAFRTTLENLLRDMSSEVTTKDLGAFMTSHFEDARNRAAEVTKARIRDLDAEKLGGQPTSASNVRAARSAPKVKTSERHNPSASGREPDQPQVGGAAAGLAFRVSGGKKEKEAARAAPSFESDGEKMTSPPPVGRGRAVLIALAGIGLAAALVFFGTRRGRIQSQTAPPPPAAPAVSANVAPAASVPVTAEAPAVTSAPAQPPAAIPSALRETSSPASPRRRHPPTMTPPAAAIAVQPSPAPTSSVSPAPVPTSSPSASSSDHPSLDKQDPWKANGKRLDGADPWGAQGATRPPQDPWAK